MMTSWKFWSALQNPPALNPIFRRVVHVEYLFNLQLSRWLWFQPLAVIIFGLIVLWALITKPQLVILAVLIVPMSFLFIVLIVPILLVIGSNLLGIFWSSVVSTAIIKEHERGTYDLLCLLPDGILGANWAIGSGCIHRGAFFDLMYMAVRALLVFGFILLGIMLVITLGIAAGTSFYNANDDLFQAVRTVLDLISLIIGYYVHYVQAIVLSPLTGILTAIYVRSQLEARLLAPIFFLALQIGGYTLTFFIAFNILPGLYSHFFVVDSLAYMTLPFAQLSVFCGIREMILFGVWLLIKQQFNVHPSEFKRLISLPQ
jgi:hypothetical protein